MFYVINGAIIILTNIMKLLLVLFKNTISNSGSLTLKKKNDLMVNKAFTKYFIFKVHLLKSS